jgi:hypothetical protein
LSDEVGEMKYAERFIATLVIPPSLQHLPLSITIPLLTLLMANSDPANCCGG